jgi:hypothetical protein
MKPLTELAATFRIEANNTKAAINIYLATSQNDGELLERQWEKTHHCFSPARRLDFHQQQRRKALSKYCSNEDMF